MNTLIQKLKEEKILIIGGIKTEKKQQKNLK